MAHTGGTWRIMEMYTAHGLTMNDGAINITNESGAICTVMVQADIPRRKAYKAVDPERDANARLIAASPELLEAVKTLYSIIPDDKAAGLGWVEALINKAESAQ